MAAWFPTQLIPNQLVLSILVPAATASAAGFHSVTRRRLIGEQLCALDEVKTLQGLLPICMYCKALRNTTIAALCFIVLWVVLAITIPGKGAVHLLLLSVLVPVATSVIAGFQAISRRRLLEQLTGALAEVRTLRGVLPICTECKNLLDEAGDWQQLECYVADHSEARFSHGVCEACYPRLEADFAMS